MGGKNRHVEPLNGGLVNSRDPALLNEGELSEMRNAVYKRNSQSLQRAVGRQQYGPAIIGGTAANYATATFSSGTSGGAQIDSFGPGGAASATWYQFVDDEAAVGTADGMACFSFSGQAGANFVFASSVNFATGTTHNFMWSIYKDTQGNAPWTDQSGTIQLQIADNTAQFESLWFSVLSNLPNDTWTTYSTSYTFPSGGFSNPVVGPNSWGINVGTGPSGIPAGCAIQVGSFYEVVGATSLADIIGIRDAHFDNGNHYLLVHASSYYLTGAVADTGSLATSTTATQGTTLDSIHYNNEFYILNGTAADLTDDSLTAFNQVMYLSATATGTSPSWRLHGLNPVTETPGVSTATGTWTAETTGFFEYWTTEVFEYTRDGNTEPIQIESTFSGDPETIYVPTTGIQATITRPTQINPAATKWRVYRSPAKELETDVMFPVGFKLGTDYEFATTTAVTDGGATTGAYAFATTTAADLSPSPLTQFATPTNVFSSNDAYATHTGVADGSLVVGFASFSVTPPILGLTVHIEGRKNSDIALLGVQVSNDGGFLYSTMRSVAIQNSVGDGAVEIGSASDKWGLNWSESGVLSNKFRVRLQGFTRGGGSLFIDAIKAKFTYAGTDAGDGEIPFPAVIINQSDLTVGVGSHGKPPVADTGDVFEDCMVLNDVTKPSFIRYSLAGQPDYFPEVYFIDFETPDNDRVTNIKTLNNRLGAFLRNQVYRVNYLPNENDAQFDRGRAIDAVSTEYGAYNCQCVTHYTSGDGRTQLAFISDHGIHTTDLFSVQTLSDDLDWRTVVATANSNPICLINDPDNWELLAYYKNTTVSDTEHYRCIHLNYHPSHLKNGRPKLSGQVHMRNYTSSGGGIYAAHTCAWVVKRSGGYTSVYHGYGGGATATAAGAGYVYMETGDTIPAFDPNFQFTTRRMYLNGMGKEFRLNEMYAYVPSAAGTPTIQYTPYTVKTNDTSGEVSQGAKSFTYNSTLLHKVQFNQTAEGLRINATQTANASSIKYEMLLLDGEDFGNEDSGR